MSDRERVEALAWDIWHDFEGSPFIDVTERDAESIARSVLVSPAIRDLLAEAKADAWDEGYDAASWRAFKRTDVSIGRSVEADPANPYRETTTGGRDG